MCVVRVHELSGPPTLPNPHPKRYMMGVVIVTPRTGRWYLSRSFGMRVESRSSTDFLRGVLGWEGRSLSVGGRVRIKRDGECGAEEARWMMGEEHQVTVVMHSGGSLAQASVERRIPFAFNQPFIHSFIHFN